MTQQDKIIDLLHQAVRNGDADFVRENISSVDLNDPAEGGYLRETEDPEMRRLLIEGGALISYDDYTNCRLAMESTACDVIAYSGEFQEELLERYLAFIGMNARQVIKLYSRQQKKAAAQYEQQKQKWQEEHGGEQAEAADESDFVVSVWQQLDNGRWTDVVRDLREIGFEIVADADDASGRISALDIEYEPRPRLRSLLEEMGMPMQFEGRHKTGIYFIR